MENLSTKLTTPWTPVTTPSTVQRRLQRVTVEEGDLSSSAVIADGPHTCGNKLRARAENILKLYVTETEKVDKSYFLQFKKWCRFECVRG